MCLIGIVLISAYPYWLSVHVGFRHNIVVLGKINFDGNLYKNIVPVCG